MLAADRQPWQMTADYPALAKCLNRFSGNTMPLFLLLLGVIFLVAAIRGNQNDLLDLLKDDFSGDNNFLLWVLSLVILVGVGQFKAVRPISDAFLGLIILVIIIANYKRGGDIFSSFIVQLKSGTS